MQTVHVAVGVITNSDGDILIARRPATAHQGGLWEFPGGKVESGETVQQALARELHEELGVHTGDYSPLIQVAHDYGDKAVLLDVYRARILAGSAHGKEGQPLAWVNPGALHGYDFPLANRPIIRALTLPSRLLITGEFTDTVDFSRRLQGALAQGIELVQLRAHALSDTHFSELVQTAQQLLPPAGARLVINRMRPYADTGLHLTAAALMQYSQRPLPAEQLLGASCHSAEEILQANRLQVDYICLSPVQATRSHPAVHPLGWDHFAALTRLAAAPVYALGGMNDTHLATAISHGGQGIAGISAWW